MIDVNSYQIRIHTAEEIAAAQLKLMEEFYQQLRTTAGYFGISQRHLDAFQDMMNETKLRSI